MPYLIAEDGIPIYYTDRGQGEPIFLIHGWTMNHKFFQHNIPALSQTHRVVTMDIRGHGHSGKQELNLTLPQAARDAQRVIEHLGLGNVTLAGWSMGNLLVFNYIEQFGFDKLKGVVFIEGTPYLVSEGGWEHGAFGDFDLKAAYELERDIFQNRLAVEEAFISACFKRGEAPDEATKEWWLRESMLTPTGTMVAFWASGVAHDWRGLLSQIPVPVLLCYGTNSAICPTKIGDYMQEYIPNSTLVEFEASGHSPFWEEPEKFNTEMSRFASR